MRIMMVSGSPGKAEGGVAGIVHNLAKELGQLGHSVEPKFFEDLLPAQKWPSRFCAIEFSRRIAGYVQEKKSEFDIINIHAPFGFWYGTQRWLRGDDRSEEHTSELQSHLNLVCRLLLEKKK